MRPIEVRFGEVVLEDPDGMQVKLVASSPSTGIYH
jgi:hypothetical protein